jgi:hypothetical protein
MRDTGARDFWPGWRQNKTDTHQIHTYMYAQEDIVKRKCLTVALIRVSVELIRTSGLLQERFKLIRRGRVTETLVRVKSTEVALGRLEHFLCMQKHGIDQIYEQRWNLCALFRHIHLNTNQTGGYVRGCALICGDGEVDEMMMNASEGVQCNALYQAEMKLSCRDLMGTCAVMNLFAKKEKLIRRWKSSKVYAG